MSIQVRSGASGSLASVDANNNLQVNLPTTASQAGYSRMLDGEGNPIVTTENGAQYVSSDNMVFWEQVDGNFVNTNTWNQFTSGMTIVQAGGFISLNAGAAKTASAYAILSAIKNIPLYGTLPIKISFNCFIPLVPQANLTMEMGIGSVATNAAPTDGVFFRWANSGAFQAVMNNSGVETVLAITPTPSISEVELFEIVLVEDQCLFYVGDTLSATVQVPAGQAFPTGSGRLPIFFRVYNSGSAPANAPNLQVGQVVVVQQDMLQNKPWNNTLLSMGRGAYQSPVSGFGTTANITNSSAPSSITLSNTTPGNASTVLEGRYQFAMVVGAVTDYAVFAFQVPAGYQLVIPAVRITAINTGAANGATATILEWSLGVNSSAASLATADGTGTWAPRRIALGMQGFLASAGIGQAAVDINSTVVDIIVDSGRFLHVILQIPVGAATASQVIRGCVAFPGAYFE